VPRMNALGPPRAVLTADARIKRVGGRHAAVSKEAIPYRGHMATPPPPPVAATALRSFPGDSSDRVGAERVVPSIWVHGPGAAGEEEGEAAVGGELHEPPDPVVQVVVHRTGPRRRRGRGNGGEGRGKRGRSGPKLLRRRWWTEDGGVDRRPVATGWVREIEGERHGLARPPALRMDGMTPYVVGPWAGFIQTGSRTTPRVPGWAKQPLGGGAWTRLCIVHQKGDHDKSNQPEGPLPGGRAGSGKSAEGAARGRNQPHSK